MTFTLDSNRMSERALEIANRIEGFIREKIVPYEYDDRRNSHGPTEALGDEMKDAARQAGVMTPHILEDGTHLTHRETACVLIRSGLPPARRTHCMRWLGAAIRANEIASDYANRRIVLADRWWITRASDLCWPRT